MKVLVTGGSGFIGQNLAQRLLQLGHEVLCVDNHSRKDSHQNIQQVLKPMVLDLCEPSSVNVLSSLEFDVVVHLAAIVGVANVVRSPYQVLDVNAQALMNLISGAVATKSQPKIIFASTSEVYAGGLEILDLEFPTPENTPIVIRDFADPRGTYSLSKIYGEALCAHSGLPFIIVRPHNIFGPAMGYSHVIPELTKKMIYASRDNSAAVVSIASADHTRSFCYIDDAIKQFISLISNDACVNQCFNMGNPNDEISIWDLALRIRDILKLDRVRLMAGPQTAGSPARRVPNMGQYSALVPESICYTSFEESLEATVRWYARDLDYDA